MAESGNSAGSTRAMVPFTNDPSSTHNTTRANFKCPVPRCGRTFVHHYDLRSHIRTHSQGNSPQPSASLLSIRSTPESSGYQSDTGSQEGAHRRGQRRAIEGPRPSSLSQSGDTQFKSQSSISDVWSQQTTHPAPALAALSLSESGTPNTTPLRNSSPASQHDTEGEPGETLDAASPPLEIPTSSDRGLGRENTELESEARHTSQGTKRRLEDYHEPNNEEEGGKPKRGKVIHRDYAGVSADYVESSSEERSVGGPTQGMGMDNATSDAQSTVEIKSTQLTCKEMFDHLVAHGCVDLTSSMDPEKYSEGLILGGAFGDIWKGKLRDGSEVAIKVWRFSSLIPNDSKSLKRAMREIYHWSKVKHEYVQELMGVIMFKGRLGMVSRWMDNGNLREYIHKHPSVDRYVLCNQVATGVAYLHSQNMVHGDLKGTNILVARDGIAKLSDFDHSIMSECSLAFSETSKMGGGTTRWMAPELILESDCSRSAYTDVYALGMTMLEIITGTLPYYPQCRDDVGVIGAIMKKTLPIRPMKELSNNSRDNRMWELLLSCWDYDPLARPKAAQVVESLKTVLDLPTSNPV